MANQRNQGQDILSQGLGRISSLFWGWFPLFKGGGGNGSSEVSTVILSRTSVTVRLQSVGVSIFSLEKAMVDIVPLNGTAAEVILGKTNIVV